MIYILKDILLSWFLDILIFNCISWFFGNQKNTEIRNYKRNFLYKDDFSCNLLSNYMFTWSKIALTKRDENTTNKGENHATTWWRETFRLRCDRYIIPARHNIPRSTCRMNRFVKEPGEKAGTDTNRKTVRLSQIHWCDVSIEFSYLSLHHNINRKLFMFTKSISRSLKLK